MRQGQIKYPRASHRLASARGSLQQPAPAVFCLPFELGIDGRHAEHGQ